MRLGRMVMVVRAHVGPNPTDANSTSPTGRMATAHRLERRIIGTLMVAVVATLVADAGAATATSIHTLWIIK